MPYSFTKIEEDKSKTISFVFSFLIFVYFLVFWLIALLTVHYFQYEANPQKFSIHLSALRFSHTLIILGLAMIIGYIHWNYSTSDLIQKILRVLRAERLNPKDHYHQMLQNIVDEVSVATGGKKIDAVVIPTMAMNAFAVADFSGQAVIGVTEGVLARLSRAQIEAVVGHEAAHVVSGDCLATTVTTSLFELFNGVLRGLESIFKGGGRSSNYPSMRVQSRGGGAAIIFLILVYALLAITKLLSQLARLFLSRQREYRADAVAVRLTRDPLSLAEALYAIAYRWRGGGLAAQELQSIFIVNPVFSAIDENNGLWSEMFSTHPPIDGRISLLLDMAHSDVESVIKDVERQAQKPRTAAPEIETSSVQWVAHKDGAWQGPFNLAQMTALGWMRPETWVQRLGDNKVQMAYQDQDIRHVVSKAEDGQTSGAFECPKCCLPLTTVVYEGTEVYKCPACGGTLVREKEMQRIIIRQEIGFNERIIKIAEGIQNEGRQPELKVINRDPKTLLKCPKCNHVRNRMMRMFFTEAYHVEVDKCFACGMIWFDHDELEALQYLIEHSLDRSLS
ncbi:MAG: M48 family metalloprotease [Candidatus Omnitrophica bacterium]|nr:M48 family metalloprotease [Candidatus Omnitrophota bacterium]